MTDTEMRLLTALAQMAAQYLEDGDHLDSLSMSAGQDALAVLAEHGLVDADEPFRFGRWTAAGRRLLGRA